MKEKQTRTISFVLVGMFAIGLGASILFPNYYFVFGQLSKARQLIHLAGVFIWLKAFVYSALLPLFLIVGGVAFLFFKRFGVFLVRFGLIFELLLRLEGLILFWFFCLRTKQPILSEPVSQASMIPSYFIVSIEFLILFYLVREGKPSKGSLK